MSTLALVWPKRLGLLAASGLVALLAAELSVRAFVRVRDVGPPFSEYDAVLGQRLKRGLTCERRTPEFRMRFSSNSLGWRGPEPAGATAEILFLGDSFTMGYGVDDGREFPQLVARALGRSVVNMGVGGTGNGRWPVLLRGEAVAFEPEIVVLQLCSNDLDDDLGEGLASLDERGELVLHAPPPPSAGRHLQRVLELVPGLAYSHLLGLLRQCKIRGGSAEPVAHASGEASGERPGLALALALLEESIRCCVERSWTVVVLSADMSASEAEPFRELCARAGVEFLRMPSKSEASELYFAVDGHWNEAGHLHAADLLLASLLSPRSPLARSTYEELRGAASEIPVVLGHERGDPVR